MIQVMSEEESQQHEKDMNDWWISLDTGLKMDMYNLFKHISEDLEKYRDLQQYVKDPPQSLMNGCSGW